MSIEVKHLSFSYGSRQVLKDINFSVGRGRLLSVLGPNGVGKSTLFRCILGLLHGFQGEITVDGAVVSSLGARELARKVAYIPQSNYPAFQYSVFDMVLMGTTAQSRASRPPAPSRSPPLRRLWSGWTSAIWRSGATPACPAVNGSWCSSPAPWPSSPPCC